MAGQAGWYRAPGEEGLLRYWNGTAWTNHRQPDPAAVAAPVEVPAIDDSDPMAHFEKQFATSSLLDSDFEGEDESTTSAPQYRPRSAVTPTSPISLPAAELVSNGAGATSSLGPIALGPSTAATPDTKDDASLSEFDRFFNEMAALAGPETGTIVTHVALPQPTETLEPEVAPLAQTPAVEAPAAKPVPVGIAPNRKAVMAAARIMIGGLLLIVLGVGAMAFFSLAGNVSAGEVKTNAIVTSLGATTNNACTPVARFAVKGKSYTAAASSAITPCPIGLGQSVDVIYSASNPASAARIEVGGSIADYLWIVPILGGLTFVAGFVTFIVRAGPTMAGIRLLRKPAAAETVAVPAA